MELKVKLQKPINKKKKKKKMEQKKCRELSDDKLYTIIFFSIGISLQSACKVSILELDNKI